MVQEMKQQITREMTRPIHSVKQIQSTYTKFQLLVVIASTVTIIAVVLAAISSAQLGKLFHRQIETSAKQTIGIEAELSKRLTSTTQEIDDLNRKLKEINDVVKELRNQNTVLQKRLTAATQATSPLPALQADPKPMETDTTSEPQPQGNPASKSPSQNPSQTEVDKNSSLLQQEGN